MYCGLKFTSVWFRQILLVERKNKLEQKKEDIFDRLMHLPGLRIFEKFYKKNKEVLLYLLFGGLTTIVSIGTFAWFNVGMHMNELIANVISWVFSVAFAYVTNRIWVFRSETSGVGSLMKEIAKFFGGRLATLGVEELILFVFISLLHGNSMVVKLIAQVVIVILNYIISKIFVFNNKK